MKKLLILHILVLLPLIASADDSGSCGENLTYFYVEGTHTLTISGTGKMADYNGKESPWSEYQSEITTVIINKGVTSIGSYAFGKCINLSSVTIPEGVTSIGNYAFDNCNSLPSINIPEGVTIIEEGVFYECSSLLSIDLPTSLTTIGYGAFYYCSSLQSIVIPGGVESIVGKTFVGCTSLSSLTFSDGVKNINTEFYGCKKLKTLFIPKSVISIGPFEEYFFETIIVDEENPIYDSRDNCNAIIETASNTLLIGCVSTTIPSSVTSVASGAFSGIGTRCGESAFYSFDESNGILTISGRGDMYNYNSNSPWYSYQKDILKIIIGEGVTTIGSGAFSGCSNLTSVSIPEGVTSIESSAFMGCSGLTSLAIPNSVTNIESEAFRNCYSITSAIVGNSVINIERSAFFGCTNLTSIVIPNSVTKIGYGAFEGCNGLIKVTIGNSVTSIEDNAFNGCTGLTGVHISDLAAWCNIKNSSNPLSYAHRLYLNGEEVKDLVIPNSVTVIESSAFSGCNGLTSVTIGSSVTNIENDAFENCSGLTSVTIPNSVTHIGKYAFRDCTGLTSINIYSSMTVIDNYAFDRCKKLGAVHIADLEAWCKINFSSETSNPLYYAHHLYLNDEEIKDLIIPDNVTSIGSLTFQYGQGFTSLRIPNHITTISENAFKGCSGLTSVVLPNQLRIIKANAFNGCLKLESLNIPASVEYIYQNAFAGCSSLQSVNAQPTTPPFLYDNSFPDYTVPLNVPSGCKDSYQTAQGWRNFTTINDGNMYYQLSVKAEGPGKVTYNTIDVTNGQQTFSIKEGTDVVLTLTPNDGYRVATVTVNGEDKTADVVDGQLTISNVMANVVVNVSFITAGETASVSISSAGMATLCSTKDLDFTEVGGLKAYTGAGFNRTTGALTMLEVKDAPAGTGLVLIGSEGTYDIPVKPSASVYGNLLVGVTEDTQLAQTADGYTNYILGNGNHGLGFYIVTAEGGTLAAGKAYLRLPTVTANARRVISIEYGEGVTAVDDQRMTPAESDGSYYTLNGQRMTGTPSKAGVYIKDGHKVIIK